MPLKNQRMGRMNPREPSRQRFANPLTRYVAAIRPAFLSVTRWRLFCTSASFLMPWAVRAPASAHWWCAWAEKSTLGLLGYWLLPLICGWPTLWSAVGLLPAVLSLQACRRLFHEAHHPARLASAIKTTMAAANLHGLLISMALMLGARP